MDAPLSSLPRRCLPGVWTVRRGSAGSLLSCSPLGRRRGPRTPGALNLLGFASIASPSIHLQSSLYQQIAGYQNSEGVCEWSWHAQIWYSSSKSHPPMSCLIGCSVDRALIWGVGPVCVSCVVYCVLPSVLNRCDPCEFHRS